MNESKPSSSASEDKCIETQFKADDSVQRVEFCDDNSVLTCTNVA